VDPSSLLHAAYARPSVATSCPPIEVSLVGIGTDLNVQRIGARARTREAEPSRFLADGILERLECNAHFIALCDVLIEAGVGNERKSRHWEQPKQGSCIDQRRCTSPGALQPWRCLVPDGAQRPRAVVEHPSLSPLRTRAAPLFGWRLQAFRRPRHSRADHGVRRQRAGRAPWSIPFPSYFQRTRNTAFTTCLTSKIHDKPIRPDPT
jgi:hypothetical protein